MADRIGEIIGNYRVESLLGAGGMGQVFLGVHRHLDRRAAIKVMHAHLAADPGFQARFVREARAAAALSHPNIVEIYDFGEQNGLFYLVMELMPDGSLGSLLRPAGDNAAPLDVQVGLGLVLQATQGLAYAHAQGMVHRDVKPDNLLLKRNGPAPGDDYLVKVCDFGLARLAESAAATTAGLMMGTPAYMSPEQCQGLTLDSRSDQYSLGVVLYEVVTGQRPFSARTPTEAIQQHVYDPPPSPRSVRPDVAPELDAIIVRCLAKQPDDRYPTTDALLEALRAAQATLDAALPPRAAATVTPGAANYAAARALEGRQLNRYRIDTLRSAGPLTWDYIGQHLGLERSVVVKVLRPEFAHDPAMTERFLNDARLAARVRHPGLVEVLDTGAAEGFSFVALDAVEGLTLRQRLDQGRLTSGEALRFLRQAADALDYAHSQGITQRDLQPRSIVVRPDGSLVLLDFGDLSLVAERSRTTTKPSAAREAYIAPERASGAQADPRSDIYALGCLAYELLSGKAPFVGTPAADGNSDPQFGLRSDAPGLSPLVSTVIARTLDRNPEDRYATAGEFVRVLTSALPDPDGVTERISQAVAPRIPQPVPAAPMSQEVIAASAWPVVTDPAVTSPSAAVAVAAPLAPASDPTIGGIPPVEPPLGVPAGGTPSPVADARSRWPLAVLGLAAVLVVAAVWLLRGGGSGTTSATATSGLGGGGATATTVAVVVAQDPTATHGPTATVTQSSATATANAVAAASATAQAAATATPTKLPTATPSPTVAVTPTYDWFAAERAGLIAFVTGRRPDNPNIPDIYVMNADGSDQRRLLTIAAADAYPSSDPAWSHDGKRLAFTSSRDGNDEIYVMNVDGSGLNNLTHTQAADNSPDWWADDSKLVFQSNRDGNYEIYTMEADGSNPTDLTKNPATDWGPKWSPAGDAIVFVSDRNGANQIFVMQYDGANQHALTTVAGAQDYNPSWSPDGSQIAFARDTGSGFHIFVMNADGSSVRQLTNNTAQDGTPTWSPDGNTILFRSDRDGNPEVYSMHSDGSNQHRLTNNPTYDGSPIYAPTGR